MNHLQIHAGTGLLSGILLGILLLSAVACEKEKTPTEGPEMHFHARCDEVYKWSDTKSDPLNDSGHSSFQVWATKTVAQNNSDITGNGGYRVNYVGDEWTYTGGEGIGSQGLLYWDNNASAYHFHAGTPATAVSAISSSSVTLSMTATDQMAGTVLYSLPKVVNDPNDFGANVTMSFKQANCRVRTAFIYDVASDIELSEIKFTPVTSYTSAGKISVNYDWSASPATATPAGALTETSTSTTPLSFSSVSIAAGSSTAVESDTDWYMLPETDTDENSSAQWKLSLKVGGTAKEATFDQGKKWRPGYSYLYQFTILDNSVILKLVVIDDWEETAVSVVTEQYSLGVKTENADWSQENINVFSYEFVPLYTESTKSVLWAESNLNSYQYSDITQIMSWTEVTPASPGDTEYLKDYFDGNTDFNWETPTRADFDALFSSTNTTVTMEQDEESSVYGLVITSKADTGRSIFIPCSDQTQIETVIGTTTEIKRTYSGSYWTRDEDSTDTANAFKLLFSFTRTETRTPTADGTSYTSAFSDLKGALENETLYKFESVLKTTAMSVRPLLKVE